MIFSLRLFDGRATFLAIWLSMSVTSIENRLFKIYAEIFVSAEISRLPGYEDWYAFMERIAVPGRMHEITADAYRSLLEASTPRLYSSNRFCVANADGLLRLFWTTGGRYFCRQLTREESNRVCDASGLPREYGMYLD